LARDLAVPYPSVGLDDEALEAVRLTASQHLPGIVVCTEDGPRIDVLPGSQVLAFVIPHHPSGSPITRWTKPR
jgi:hypothetical protein